MSEITILTTAGSQHLKDIAKIQAEYIKKDTSLNTLLSSSIEGSDLYRALINEQERELTKTAGLLLGLLKSAVDTSPKHVSFLSDENLERKIKYADGEIKSCLQIQIFSKLRPGMRLGTFEKYEALSKGGTHNISIENFREFFPGDISYLIGNFAIGYSKGFHTLVGEIKKAKEVDWTSPMQKDVWKNLSYFIDPVCKEYRLDGVFPFSKKDHFFNTGIYEKLRSRSSGNFTTATFVL